MPACMPTGASLVSLMPICSSPMGNAECGSAVIHSRKFSCTPSVLDRTPSSCMHPHTTQVLSASGYRQKIKEEYCSTPLSAKNVGCNRCEPMSCSCSLNIHKRCTARRQHHNMEPHGSWWFHVMHMICTEMQCTCTASQNLLFTESRVWRSAFAHCTTAMHLHAENSNPQELSLAKCQNCWLFSNLLIHHMRYTPQQIHNIAIHIHVKCRANSLFQKGQICTSER